MIKAEFNGKNAKCEIKGNLGDVMEEFTSGTLALLEGIEKVNVEAAIDMRAALINELVRWNPGRDTIEVFDKGVQ